MMTALALRKEEEENMSFETAIERDFERIQAGSPGAHAHISQDKRLQAFQSFLGCDSIPGHKESWKYTSLQKVRNFPLTLAPAGETATLESIEQALSVNFENKIVVLNGKIISQTLSRDFLGAVDVIGSLEKGYRNGTGEPFRELLKSEFGRAVSTANNPIVALNTALAEEVLVLRVKKESKVSRPLQLVFATSADSASASCSRVLLVAEQGSKLDLVESHIVLGTGPVLSVPVMEVVVHEGAQLNITKLIFGTATSQHLSAQGARLSDAAEFCSTVFTFGGMLTRNEAYPVIAGSGVKCSLNGFTVTKGSEHVDHVTAVEHASPESESFQTFKGVYSGRSTGVFTGTIIVAEGAQKTNAFQSNKSILLSRDAESMTRPQLKIWADDVKCTHGATVGQIDEAALFYLRSRGIPQEQARQILMSAFAEDVLKAVPESILEAGVQQAVTGRLEELFAE